jgi:hypothetical protein
MMWLVWIVAIFIGIAFLVLAFVLSGGGGGVGKEQSK